MPQKDCIAQYESEEAFVIYVKKGSSCAIDVTFEQGAQYKEKIESITLCAND